MQVDRLHAEKAGLQKEKTDLQRTVSDLGSSIDKMHRDKVAMESQMEMEEEGIVNRLNRYNSNYCFLTRPAIMAVVWACCTVGVGTAHCSLPEFPAASSEVANFQELCLLLAKLCIRLLLKATCRWASCYVVGQSYFVPNAPSETHFNLAPLSKLHVQSRVLSHFVSVRQLDAVMSNMQALESKLEAKGINVKELGPLPYDYPTE